MRSFAMTVMSMSLLACAPADASPSDSDRQSGIRIARRESQPPAKGPAENFTGNVRVEGRFQAEAPARVGVAGRQVGRVDGKGHRRAIPAVTLRRPPSKRIGGGC